MTVRKSISFTEPHDSWLKAPIASGKYTSDSEIVRDLIRQQQAREESLASLGDGSQERFIIKHLGS